ncbi:hypothetical protein D3C87_1069610 [compost metagenome]
MLDSIKRVTFSITVTQDKFIELFALATGLGKSEVIRDLLDDAVCKNRDFISKHLL